MVEYLKPWLLFWSAAIISHLYMDRSLILKWRSWNRGITPPPSPKGRRARVIKIWTSEVFLQRQLFALSPFRWFIHMLIFYGFVGLAALSFGTVAVRLLGFAGIDGGLAHFLLAGKGYLLSKIWGDACGTILLAGLLAALVKRVFFRSAQQDNKQIDIFLLIFLLWLTVSGFALEAVRVAVTPGEAARYSFFARLLVPSGVVALAGIKPWLTSLWIVHALSALGLLIYFPHSKLMHSLLAPVVIAMNAEEEQHREDIYWPDVKKHRATKSRAA